MATLEELFEQIKAEHGALVTEAKALIADGLSWGEAWILVRRATETIVAIVDVVQAAGDQKKALALLCVDKFYDQVIAPIDIPYVPNWLETRFVDPAIGKAVHEFAEIAIDRIVDLWNKDGWPVIGKMGPLLTR